MQVEKSKNCITAENVNFGYDNDLVLENVSFSIDCGDYVGIIGPNGGGKTTLLQVILGLIRPKSGKVTVMGKDISEGGGCPQVGYVPQRITTGALEFPATVHEVLLSGRTPRKGILERFSKKDFDEVNRAMETTGTLDLKERLIGDLSGGQRQRVFIARALAQNPEILVLDEPTTGVDARSQQQFYEFLGRLNNEFGITILFVSHDIDVVSREVKTVLCLNRTLICHTPIADFDEQDVTKRMYSEDVRALNHGNEKH